LWPYVLGRGPASRPIDGVTRADFVVLTPDLTPNACDCDAADRCLARGTACAPRGGQCEPHRPPAIMAGEPFAPRRRKDETRCLTPTPIRCA
jgi:hypothetical protein